MLIIDRKGKKEGKEGKEGKERGTGARVCTSTRRECTSLYEYHPNRQRDLEGTSKGEGRYEKKGTGGYG